MQWRGGALRRDLVSDHQLTGEITKCVLIDGTVREAPVARLQVNTPYYNGWVSALCMKNPLYDLILGNIQGMRAADDADQEWTVGAVLTRSMSKSKPFRPLKTLPSLDIVKPEDLKREQKNDETLIGLWDLAEARTERKSGKYGLVYYSVDNDILMRHYRSPKVDGGNEATQVVVPKRYRSQVMRVAHESLLGGHQGSGKTTDKVLRHFFWPGINAEITRYCRSCDACQRTIQKGKVTKVPLGKMP